MNYRGKIVVIATLVVLASALFFLLSSCTSFESSLEDDLHSSGELQEKERKTGSASAAGVDVQVYRDRPLEEIVSAVPKRISNNIGNNPDLVLQDLVRYLTKDEPDPFLQVKNLHDWICDNITYDAEGYFSGNYSGTDYGSVLRSGKSVCDGYAGLFLRMADIAGFNAVKISGHAKGYGFDPVHRKRRESTHAWNGVEIGGNWYLLDCTWDAGHVTTEGYTKKYSTGYLFLAPEYMIFTHHPDQDRWQLIKTPVSYDDYLDLHFFRGEYFNYLSVDGDGSSEQRSRFVVQQEALLKLSKKSGSFITAVLEGPDMTQYENRAYVDNEFDKITVHAVFPEAGSYKIRLFGFTGLSGEWLGDIILQAKKGSDIKMPLVYSNFIQHQFRIIKPEAKYLLRGQPGTVTVYAPGWETALVQMGGKSFEMEAAGTDQFRVDLPEVTAGEIDVFGSSNENSNSYEGACKIFAVE